jgi:hypothetical protein
MTQSESHWCQRRSFENVEELLEKAGYMNNLAFKCSWITQNINTDAEGFFFKKENLYKMILLLKKI